MSTYLDALIKTLEAEAKEERAQLSKLEASSRYTPKKIPLAR